MNSNVSKCQRGRVCVNPSNQIFLLFPIWFFSCFPNFCFLFGELHWKCQREGVCKSVKPPALQLGLLFYAEGFSRFSAYKRHIFYAGTRLRPRSLQIEYPSQTSLFAISSGVHTIQLVDFFSNFWRKILGRQSESNSHSCSDRLICNFFGSSHNFSYLKVLFSTVSDNDD